MKKQDKKPRFTLEPMEPRLLLSADIEAALGIDAVASTAAALTPAQTSTLETNSTSTTADSQEQAEVRRELVLVDNATPDYQQLVFDLVQNSDDSRQFDVIYLNQDRDGIQQITETLANYRDLDAVHLIAHGSDAAVQLGNATLDATTLATQAGNIESWGNAFTAEGDLLIYGCKMLF